MSPGLTNESVHLVHGAPRLVCELASVERRTEAPRTADIELDAAENVNPAQAADDLGNIEVLRVPLTGLRAALDAHSAAGGTVYAGLWTLVAGMEAAVA